jgi:hypothetical protein
MNIRTYSRSDHRNEGGDERGPKEHRLGKEGERQGVPEISRHPLSLP